MESVSEKLDLEIAVWSSPTAVILSFQCLHSDAQKTQVLRMQPGDIDLRTMCTVDDIAERVTTGELNAQSGARALTLAGAPVTELRLWLETVSGFVLASVGVACLLKAAWGEIATAGVSGLLIALIHLTLGRQGRFKQGVTSLSALAAAFFVTAVGHFLIPLNYRLTLLTSLIVLVPGLSITTAASEIATQHLVSGTARMAGAFATLLKLAFGALVGAKLAESAGFVVMPGSLVPAPEWVGWFGLILSGLSFALLFKALARDYPLAIFASTVGYTCTVYGGAAFGQEFGVFFAGLVVMIVSNVYARWSKRPGALMRLPGIILLVPGSVGFRSLSFVFQKDLFLGLDTAVSLLLLVVSLVAGLLLASSILPSRRAL